MNLTKTADINLLFLRSAVALAGLFGITQPAALTAQKALVYCPSGVTTPCNNIVNALTSTGGGFTSSEVKLASSGTSVPTGYVNLATANLSSVQVIVVPALSGTQYNELTNSGGNLKPALTGRVAIWSGTPDQQTSDAAKKRKLIQNLATWAKFRHSGTAHTGLVVLQDMSSGGNYGWLSNITSGVNASENGNNKTYHQIKAGTANSDVATTVLNGVESHPSMAAEGLATTTGSNSSITVDLAALGQWANNGGTHDGNRVLLTFDRPLVAPKQNQTITFEQPTTPAAYNSTFAVSATASSGLTVSFAVSPASVCSLTGTTVKMTSGTGDCTITASQAGNESYNAAESVVRTVAASKANATISVSGFNGSYDGSAKGASGTATGADGSNLSSLLNLGSSFTNVPGGTANWSFAGDANHNTASGTASIVIGKAATTTTVTCTAGPFTYTGSAHTPCSATVTGAGGLSQSLTVSYQNNTDAGTATASASYAASTNYEASSDSKTFTIAKAKVTIAFTELVKSLSTRPLQPSYTVNGQSVTTIPVEFSYSPVLSTTNAGVYDVTANVSSTSQNYEGTASGIFVVYDPSAGFVTGGGWINYDNRACPVLCGGVAGKADFGFVSKYQKGANAPTGDTRFEFHAGTLKFLSSSYEWLVVSGTRAQFKGVGKINGAGNYGFILTAVDGTTDQFRIKIVDKNNSDTVVFDNQIQDESGDMLTLLNKVTGGGSIVIHSK